MERHDVFKLAGETGCNPTTVERWAADRSRVNSTTDYALRAACAKLGIELPEPAETARQEPNNDPAAA